MLDAKLKGHALLHDQRAYKFKKSIYLALYNITVHCICLLLNVFRHKLLDKAGKVGKKSSRRRASSRLSAPRASTTESDANDISEGISDDSLTSGEMKDHSHVYNNFKIMSGFCRFLQYVWSFDL